jgi:hypothetical protein
MAFPILTLLGFIPNLLSYWQKKQEMKLRWFELIFSIFKDLLAFTIAHWRVILTLLILGYCLFSWHLAVKRADKAELALSTFKAEIQRATETQRLQNEIKKTQGENDARAIELEHKQALKRLGLAELDRATLQNKLRAFKNETNYLKNRIDGTNGNWAERLRIESERNRAGLPEEPKDNCDTAHTGINCDIAAYSAIEQHYEDLKQACQITTIDLVACLQVVESDTKAVGRYE